MSTENLTIGLLLFGSAISHGCAPTVTEETISNAKETAMLGVPVDFSLLRPCFENFNDANEESRQPTPEMYASCRGRKLVLFGASHDEEKNTVLQKSIATLQLDALVLEAKKFRRSTIIEMPTAHPSDERWVAWNAWKKSSKASPDKLIAGDAELVDILQHWPRKKEDLVFLKSLFIMLGTKNDFSNVLADVAQDFAPLDIDTSFTQNELERWAEMQTGKPIQDINVQDFAPLTGANAHEINKMACEQDQVRERVAVSKTIEVMQKVGDEGVVFVLFGTSHLAKWRAFWSNYCGQEPTFIDGLSRSFPAPR